MEKQIKIALAGNPNCGKTTLFNALTGSNQFVGNWPGVTVEKKEGKLKKHNDVVIMDLPGIYSLSPYTLEEVVARNYLIDERPDAILNIIDGTNLERNLYLTTQLTELGIPVVIAINMIDVVRKNGDQINVKELSRELGCQIVEISALKGDGVMEAAEAAVQAAHNAKTIPMHTFSGPVEHAIAHIEEAAVHNMPEEQQRWYAIKIFERDDKVLAKMSIPAETLSHIEEDIKAAEKELDDDAESIITNERYVYIAEIIKACYKKKRTGQLSASDKIDKIVTNRWLGLPIFAVVMFLVYWIAMVAVGAPATDWANDGVFGDGWHLLGIGSSAYSDTNDEYTAAVEAVDAFLGTEIDVEADDFDASALLAEMKDFQPTDKTATVDVEDEETLAMNTKTAYYDTLPEGAERMEDVVQMTYVDAVSYLSKNGFDAPDPADFGVWVPAKPEKMRSLPAPHFISHIPSQQPVRAQNHRKHENRQHREHRAPRDDLPRELLVAADLLHHHGTRHGHRRTENRHERRHLLRRQTQRPAQSDGKPQNDARADDQAHAHRDRQVLEQPPHRVEADLCAEHDKHDRRGDLRKLLQDRKQRRQRRLQREDRRAVRPGREQPPDRDDDKSRTRAENQRVFRDVHQPRFPSRGSRRTGGVHRQHQHGQHVEHRHAYRRDERGERHGRRAAERARKRNTEDHLVRPERRLRDDGPLRAPLRREVRDQNAQCHGEENPPDDIDQQHPVQLRETADTVDVQKQLHRQKHAEAESVELAEKRVIPEIPQPQQIPQQDHQQQGHDRPAGVEENFAHARASPSRVGSSAPVQMRAPMRAISRRFADCTSSVTEDVQSESTTTS